MLHAVRCRQTCFTLSLRSTQTPEFSFNSNMISRLRGLSWGWHRFFLINEFSGEIIHHVLFKHFISSALLAPRRWHCINETVSAYQKFYIPTKILYLIQAFFRDRRGTAYLSWVLNTLLWGCHWHDSERSATHSQIGELIRIQSHLWWYMSNNFQNRFSNFYTNFVTAVAMSSEVPKKICGAKTGLQYSTEWVEWCR